MSTQKHIRFDWAVKKLLRSKANFGILEGFLSELIKEDVKIMDILDSEGNKETSDDKSNRVDLLVKDSRGQLIIMEIQNTRELDYFYKILYNTSKAISEHIKEGASYREVKKVVTVCIVYFDLGHGEDYVYYGNTQFKGIHENDTLALSKTQKKLFQRDSVSDIYPEHYIIKVNEFDDNAKDGLDEWVYFLKNSEIKDEFKAKGLDQARETLNEINLSDEELAAYKRYKQDLMDKASREETIKFDKLFAVEQGREEGREEGANVKAVEMAKKLKEKGVSIDIIADTSGLAKEEIEKL